MEKRIILDAHTISYTLKRSPRARNMRLTITHEGALTVTAPHFLGAQRIENFIQEKARWIRDTLARFASLTGFLTIESRRGDYRRHKERAYALAQ